MSNAEQKDTKVTPETHSNKISKLLDARIAQLEARTPIEGESELIGVATLLGESVAHINGYIEERTEHAAPANYRKVSTWIDKVLNGAVTAVMTVGVAAVGVYFFSRKSGSVDESVSTENQDQTNLFSEAAPRASARPAGPKAI